MTHLLVDGNGLACRLWWGGAHDVPNRFAGAIVAVAEPHQAEVTACWDSPGPTWRHEVMPAYKQARPSKPEALVATLRECRALPGLRHISAPGYEADDIIATLVRSLGLADSALILSEDKDMAQLVSADVRMVNTRGEITTEADVERKWGVPPSRIRHLLSWMGDASDGLPGVPGIGAKKAIPHALAGEIGDQMTWEMVGLATVPGLLEPPAQSEGK
jgi:5'-3' exonuclease